MISQVNWCCIAIYVITDGGTWTGLRHDKVNPNSLTTCGKFQSMQRRLRWQLKWKNRARLDEHSLVTSFYRESTSGFACDSIDYNHGEWCDFPWTWGLPVISSVTEKLYVFRRERPSWWACETPWKGSAYFIKTIFSTNVRDHRVAINRAVKNERFLPYETVRWTAPSTIVIFISLESSTSSPERLAGEKERTPDISRRVEY